jgi:hypothetical protein
MSLSGHAQTGLSMVAALPFADQVSLRHRLTGLKRTAALSSLREEPLHALLDYCGMGQSANQISEDAEMCREHARRCLERAKSAPSLLSVLKLEASAHSWLRLAVDLESVEFLLMQQGLTRKKSS